MTEPSLPLHSCRQLREPRFVASPWRDFATQVRAAASEWPVGVLLYRGLNN